jgi:hypothetical protein
MTQWEYFRLETGTNMPTADYLAVLGAEGWDMAGIAFADKTIGLNAIVVMLKRECVPPPPPADLGAAWFDDPTGRFDKRYWDGRVWSAHVGITGPPKKRALDAPTMLPPTTL